MLFRSSLRISAALGIRAGILATLAYDFWRFVLVKVVGFRFNPFDTLSLFGTLIAGSGADKHVVFAVGAV